MDLAERVELLEKKVAYLEEQLQRREGSYVSREDDKKAETVSDHSQTGIFAIMENMESPESIQAKQERPVYVPRPQQMMNRQGGQQPRPQQMMNRQAGPQQGLPQQAVNRQVNAQHPAPGMTGGNINNTRYTKPVRPVPPVRREKPRSGDMESFIGKNVFVVVASVLIFVGLIVFAAAVMPYITDEIKFAAMVLGSIGLTAAGFTMTRKKQSALSISLMACGLGAIYITLFTGKIYFNFIADIPLYVFLLAWCVVVFFCERYKSLLFNIIGQLGILISLFMGAGNIYATGETHLAVYLGIYVAIAQILYNSLFKCRNYLINSLSALVSIMVLSVLTRGVVADTTGGFGFGQMISPVGPVIVCILFGLLIYIFIRNTLYAKAESIYIQSYETVGYTMFFTMIFIVSQITNNLNTGACIATLFGLLLFAVTEYVFYGEDRDISVDIYSTIMACVSVFCYFFIENSYCSALVIPCILAVYLRFKREDEETVFPIQACVTLCAAFFSTVHVLWGVRPAFIDTFSSQPSYSAYIISGIVFIFLIHIISRPDSQFEKISLYLSIATVSLCQITHFPGLYSRHEDDSRILICICLMLGLQLYTKFRKDFIDKDEPPFSQGTFICFFAVNAVCMLCSLYAMHRLNDNMLPYTISIAVAAGLFSLNVFNLMSSENSAFSPYVGIKFTVLIIAVAHDIGNNPVTSILLFGWAVVCLIFGQKLKQKPLRLYALILALLSTIKLLVFDIAYDNLVIRALSLFICGGLCFGISLFYSRLEKSNE